MFVSLHISFMSWFESVAQGKIIFQLNIRLLLDYFHLLASKHTPHTHAQQNIPTACDPNEKWAHECCLFARFNVKQIVTEAIGRLSAVFKSFSELQQIAAIFTQTISQVMSMTVLFPWHGL